MATPSVSSLLHGRALGSHLGLGGSLYWGDCGSLLGLGWRLSLDVVLVDVLLDVQERHLHVGRGVQDRLQGSIHVNVLTLLQTLLGHVLVHLLCHLGAGNLLTGSQLQELTQLLGDVQGLVEAVGGRTSLRLLTQRVLNQVLHLAQVLAQKLNLIDNSLEGDGSVSHCWYSYS